MTKCRVLLWVMIIVMLCVIFGFSAQSGESSVALSSAVASEQRVLNSKFAE
ncbi:MAG: hypothetical protein LUD81_07770 [Clostridiales bacterium]|nr:hypothetical protein [Clostridiales bacterium]